MPVYVSSQAMNSLNRGLYLAFHHCISRAWGNACNMVCVECISEEANRYICSGTCDFFIIMGQGGSSRDSGWPDPGARGGVSPNLSPIAHPVAAAEATQETVESLMQKFKESFRANTPIEIGQLQPAPRRASAGRRKRRSKSRGRPSQQHSPGCHQGVSGLSLGSEGPRKSVAPSPCFPGLVESCHCLPDPLVQLRLEDSRPIPLGVEPQLPHWR